VSPRAAVPRAESARIVSEHNNERIRAAEEAERLEAQRNADYEQRILVVEVASRQRAAENEQEDAADDESEDKASSANKNPQVPGCSRRRFLHAGFLPARHQTARGAQIRLTASRPPRLFVFSRRGSAPGHSD
jgi:hypothetical protein